MKLDHCLEMLRANDFEVIKIRVLQEAEITEVWLSRGNKITLNQKGDISVTGLDVDKICNIFKESKPRITMHTPREFVQHVVSFLKFTTISAFSGLVGNRFDELLSDISVNVGTKEDEKYSQRQLAHDGRHFSRNINELSTKYDRHLIFILGLILSFACKNKSKFKPIEELELNRDFQFPYQVWCSNATWNVFRTWEKISMEFVLKRFFESGMDKDKSFLDFADEYDFRERERDSYVCIATGRYIGPNNVKE